VAGPSRKWVEVWDKFAPVLSEAVRQDVHDFTLEQVREGVEEGVLQFWHNDSSAAVTDVVPTQSGGVGVQVLIGGGTYDGVMDCIDDITAWARERGFDSLITVGRPGWNRTPRARAWRHTGSIFVRNLKEH
jgi:hypothetical protein